jgi:hypothetical protein
MAKSVSTATALSQKSSSAGGKQNIDEIANTDRWIKGADVMPVDFEVAYSYGVGL